MPRNTTLSLPAGVWVQITETDVETISFQARGSAIFVEPTNGENPPDGTGGAILYPPLWGEQRIALDDLAEGVTGANRVYAMSPSVSGEIWVSHA